MMVVAQRGQHQLVAGSQSNTGFGASTTVLSVVIA
jgi:hypothetical protein